MSIGEEQAAQAVCENAVAASFSQVKDSLTNGRRQLLNFAACGFAQVVVQSRKRRKMIHSTSKMHSISTAMFPGSELCPTALRAPTPASSPNTSFISSEKPLMTFG